MTKLVKPVACPIPDRICPPALIVPETKPDIPDTFRKFPNDEPTPPR